MRLIFYIIFSLLLYDFGLSQQAYTSSQYAVRAEYDIPYQTAVDYAGNTINLKLDLYKPVGDNNCKRPIIVFTHGGSWIGGDRKQASFINVARGMAARGWLVASIQYRLGTHKRSNYTPYVLCPVEYGCVYNYDTAEVFRANYRGMQDMKAALRFVKARSDIDSSDQNVTFIAGESAGAFVAYWAAYLNEEFEKPAMCNGIQSVNPADADLKLCQPSTISLLLPDLGSIRGEIKSTDHTDESVLGVAIMIGGQLGHLDIKAGDPALYVYHNTNDAIADIQEKPLLSPLFQNCFNPFNLCQPMDNMPWAKGGRAVLKYLNSLTGHPILFDDTQDTGNNYCDTNLPGHAIYLQDVRAQKIANFFAPIIESKGNIPSSTCNTTGNLSPDLQNNIQFYISHSKINWSYDLDIKNIEIYDLTGRLIMDNSVKNSSHEVDLKDKITPGLYIVKAYTSLKNLHSQKIYIK